MCDRLECAFDASGSGDPDDSIVTYTWDFGDGSAPGSGAAVTHVYGQAGTYMVTLTVVDEFGA